MRQYKILVLTDHSKHSDQNSIYAILREMVNHEQCACVHVASRGNSQNREFFEDPNFKNLHIVEVNESFDYDESGRLFTEDNHLTNLDTYDAIFMRVPRPISDDFLMALNDIAKSKIILNNPLGIIECSSKAFLLNFPDLCPPMKLCKSIGEILTFSNEMEIVLKPLREYGGKGILRVKRNVLDDGDNMHNAEEYLTTIKTQIESEGLLAMQFLKNVTKGDKRLIVVNGKVLAASLRMPPEDSWLCNVARGGFSVQSLPTDVELDLVSKINPMLSERGILIYGVDTLEDDNNKRVLSEINALSIGGFPQAEAQSGIPIIKFTINEFFKTVNEFYG